MWADAPSAKEAQGQLEPSARAHASSGPWHPAAASRAGRASRRRAPPAQGERSRLAATVRAEATPAAQRPVRAHLQGFVERRGRVGLRSGILVAQPLESGRDGLGTDWTGWLYGRHLFVTRHEARLRVVHHPHSRTKAPVKGHKTRTVSCNVDPATEPVTTGRFAPRPTRVARRPAPACAPRHEPDAACRSACSCATAGSIPRQQATEQEVHALGLGNLCPRVFALRQGSAASAAKPPAGRPCQPTKRRRCHEHAVPAGTNEAATARTRCTAHRDHCHRRVPARSEHRRVHHLA